MRKQEIARRIELHLQRQNFYHTETVEATPVFNILDLMLATTDIRLEPLVNRVMLANHESEESARRHLAFAIQRAESEMIGVTAGENDFDQDSEYDGLGSLSALATDAEDMQRRTNRRYVKKPCKAHGQESCTPCRLRAIAIRRQQIRDSVCCYCDALNCEHRNAKRLNVPQRSTLHYTLDGRIERGRTVKGMGCTPRPSLSQYRNVSTFVEHDEEAWQTFNLAERLEYYRSE